MNTFPTDPIARVVLSDVPDGLVPDADVLKEFLNAPSARLGWFSWQAWGAAAQPLRVDDAISHDEIVDLLQRISSIQTAFELWAQNRPDMSSGYAETLPPDMRAAGNTAWTEVRALSKVVDTLSSKPELADDTARALRNLTDVLWSYVQCMAFELEASRDAIGVEDIRERFERVATDPWEPATKPDNVGSGGITAGGHRLPPLPPRPPGAGPLGPGTAEPTTDPEKTGATTTTEPIEPIEPIEPEKGPEGPER